MHSTSVTNQIQPIQKQQKQRNKKKVKRLKKRVQSSDTDPDTDTPELSAYTSNVYPARLDADTSAPFIVTVAPDDTATVETAGAELLLGVHVPPLNE